MTAVKERESKLWKERKSNASLSSQMSISSRNNQPSLSKENSGMSFISLKSISSEVSVDQVMQYKSPHQPPATVRHKSSKLDIKITKGK